MPRQACVHATRTVLGEEVADLQLRHFPGHGGGGGGAGGDRRGGGGEEGFGLFLGLDAQVLFGWMGEECVRESGGWCICTRGKRTRARIHAITNQPTSQQLHTRRQAGRQTPHTQHMRAGMARRSHTSHHAYLGGLGVRGTVLPVVDHHLQPLEHAPALGRAR